MFERILNRFQSSTAVIIGAGGIGGAIAQLLSQHAAHLVVADYDADALERLAGACADSKVITKTLDVRNVSAIWDFFGFVRSKVGVPDFFFYAAGVLNIESFADTTPEIWNRAVEINLNGAFYCVKAAAELMIPHQRGSIVLLGSIAGTKARSGSRVNPVYNATKAGIAALVNATAMQLRPHNIRINSIAPGPTDTSMMGVQPPEVHTTLNNLMIDGRMNHAVEVAEAALFIAAHGRFTGEDIGMGGGAGLGG